MGKQYVSVKGKSPLIASGLSHNIPAFINYLGCLASCSHVRLDVYLQNQALKLF